MTQRERWLRTMRFLPVDRGIDLEFGVWEQTIDRWHEEGLPAEFSGVWTAINEYFHPDETEYGPMPGGNIGLLPGFEYQVLEEKGDVRIVSDHDGAIAEMIRPELGASIPKYLRYAIETRADWEKMRDERLNPDDPARLPENIDELCALSHTVDYPISVWCGSLYGWIRNWMGVENLSLALYDDPAWVEEMMEHLTQVTLTVLGKYAGKAKVDYGMWWEDMCYNHGPLLSTHHFAELMVPRYRRITDFLREASGAEFNMLDCDGNIHALVPLWLEGGINVMFPLEAPHTDAYRIRVECGNNIPMRGYFDKRALIDGPAAIDAEFARLRPLYQQGGFIPHTDHLVPPDVSWANYCYYRQQKLAFLGKTEIE